MSINCHLKAVDAATAETLAADPRRAIRNLGSLRGPSFDLHKAWHAIHYVLTGTPDGGQPPHCYLLEGGITLGDPDDDYGYGPPRLLRPAEVRAFDSVLQPINRLSGLRARFPHSAMVSAGVYSMNDDDEAEDLEFTAEFFKGMRSFVHQAAQRGDGLVLSMY